MKKRMVNRMVILTLAMVGLLLDTQAQDSTQVQQPEEKTIFTLDDCIRIAMENNIQLKRAENNALIAKSNQVQAIMNFLPSVSASADYNYFDGTNFDNSSGQFYTGSFKRSTPSLNAGIQLFNAMSNVYYQKSTAQSLDASTFRIDEQKQDVKSSVLGSYLAVVLDKENIKISGDRVQLLEQQLDREKKRQEVGVGNLEQVYNFQSQLANENLRKVNLENILKTDLLRLLQLLQVDVASNMDIASYDIGEDEHLMELEKYPEILDASIAYSPGLKRASASALASNYNFKSTQAQLYPTINAYGSYGTQYSSNNVNSEGEIPIFDQYKNLTTSMVGVSISVPIFNNFRNRNNTQVARLNMENSNLDLKQAELDMTNTIQRVYLDLISAQETYEAAEENLVALNQSFEFVKTRYEHGNTDFYTYLESLNNKNRAEIELVNAKYSIVFRKKILDVYRGIL